MLFLDITGMPLPRERDCPPVAEKTSVAMVQLTQHSLMENQEFSHSAAPKPWMREQDRPDTHTKGRYSQWKTRRMEERA